MAMTYTSLTAAKGVSGSVATWVSYTKLDIPVVVDESQALLYMALRVREMRTQFTLLLPQNNSEIALPARFLDPIGRITTSSFNIYIRHALLNIERAMSKLDTEIEGGAYEELDKLYQQLDEFAEYEVPLKEIVA